MYMTLDDRMSTAKGSAYLLVGASCFHVPACDRREIDKIDRQTIETFGWSSDWSIPFLFCIQIEGGQRTENEQRIHSNGLLDFSVCVCPSIERFYE